MPKKKILFVASEFASGMRPFAATIINTLSKQPEYDVYSLCVCSGLHSYRELIDDEGHPVFIESPQGKVGKILRKFWPLSAIKAFRKMVKEVNPDVVHFLTLDFTFANYVRLCSSPRFYYTVHDLRPHEMQRKNFAGRLIDRYIKWGGLTMMKTINHLTTSSMEQLSELKAMYPDKVIRYTRFPTLVSKNIANGNKPVKELCGITGYILFFGCVDVYKGVDLLVRAFRQIETKNKPRLVIAGVGNLLDIEKLDPDVIRINRFIDDEEVGELFKNAAFVVYPYRSATMSGVLSLAYYFHKKVLLSDVPYFKDNACELTTFFCSENVEDMANKITALLNDRGRDINEDCYNRIYSSEALAHDYKALYE